MKFRIQKKSTLKVIGKIEFGLNWVKYKPYVIH